MTETVPPAPPSSSPPPPPPPPPRPRTLPRLGPAIGLAILAIPVALLATGVVAGIAFYIEEQPSGVDEVEEKIEPWITGLSILTRES